MAAGELAAREERTEFPYIGQFTIEDGKLIYRDATRRLDLEKAIATASGKTKGNIEIALIGIRHEKKLAPTHLLHRLVVKAIEYIVRHELLYRHSPDQL